jgi:Cu2+-exporting ATPase
MLINNKTIDPTLFQYAASLASHSKHPLSQAIVKAFNGEILSVTHITECAGKGLEGVINKKSVKIGNRGWCDIRDNEMTDDTGTKLELWVTIDKTQKYCFELIDTVRDDAKDVIETLKGNGLNVILLSGDRKQIVQNTAQALGIETFGAEYSPTDKALYIQNLKRLGQNILMIGDGLNDAPSLAGSNISMSPATALDIVQNTADIVFQGNKLYPIIVSYNIAKKTHRLVKENFALALIYNLVAIPLAVMGYVTPLVAALAMSSSSLIVIANSFRLLKEDR